jgi:hypothetical protein
VKLDPRDYTCPDHGIDLTGQVEQALEEDGPPLAYWGLLGRAAGPRPFEVIVTSPGTGGGAHELTCTGTCTR